MSKVALCDVRGLLSDLMDKLSGKNGRQWLEALKGFLRRKMSIDKVVIGDKSSLIRANRFILHDDETTPEMLRQIKRYPQDWALPLVVVTPEDIGLADQLPDYKTICQAAQQLGYSLCPAEVGPQLRAQYPMWEENLFVASAPLKTSTKGSCIFSVGILYEVRTRYLSYTNVEYEGDDGFSSSTKFVFQKDPGKWRVIG